MPPVFIPFDGWKPGGSYFGEGWSSTLNLMPYYNSWRPARAFVPLAGSSAFLPITGAYAHPWASGVGTSSYVPDAVTLFSGSKTRLLTVDPFSGNFTDVSRAANYAAAGEPAYWRYASVGNDVWATNHLDPPQRRVNNAGLFTDGVVSSFVPQPRFIVTIREHLVGANLSNAGRRQDEVVWSDADDATNFDPATGTSTSLAASKALTSIPGQITGLVGGQYGLAFKQLGIFYLEYTGTVQVFRPDVLSLSAGTRYPSSIINSRYGIFFLGTDGFYRITGLAEPVKISPPSVDQHLLESGFATGTPGVFTETDEDSMMLGFDHPFFPLLGWSYRPDFSQSGNNLLMFCNPVTNEWSHGNSDQLLHAIARRPIANLFDALDGFTSNKMAPLSGGLAPTVRAPTLELRYRPANFETAPTPFHQTHIRGVLPMFSKTNPIGTPLTHSVTVTPLLDPNGSPGTAETRVHTDRNPITGFYPFEVAGRFFKISIACAAEDFANFEGVWIDQRLLA